MTSPVRVSSAIVTKIIDHYKMDDRDILALTQQIRSQIEKTYLQTVQSQLNLYGCQKLATLSDKTAITWIDEKAQTDAQGIAKTYLRELTNRVNAIYSENRRTNRFGYMRALDTWLAGRTPRKSASIALNTMAATRSYAQDRFIRENNIKGRFAPVGPPPVCKICMRIFAKGPLTWEECQKKDNKFPAHANCPHRHQALVITPINCAEAWTG
jgi:hypothetical protein